ncbi:HupE/UreJ family protein [Litorimonas sp.]|uniref:HupE/UreJ family protein n=1 Tax=Litorimonas sp. TaxID=1892381 RepID=UPI003A857EA2
MTRSTFCPPMKTIRYQTGFLLLALALLGAVPAFAHTGEGLVGGFMSGFLHPVLGWDHVVAMVAVGLWGAFLRAPAIYILPIVFPVIMAFGGAAGVVGAPLPFVEAGIALSSIVLGLLIAFAVRAPLWLAAIIVGFFAVFHGHAHGTELPQASNAMSFAIGFVLATGLLHLLGIALGLLIGRPGGKVAIQIAGGLIALGGLGFLFGII